MEIDIERGGLLEEIKIEIDKRNNQSINQRAYAYAGLLLLLS